MSFSATMALLCVLTGAPSEPLVKCAEPGDAGCTLQTWMKLTAKAYLEGEDYGRLAVALRRLSNGAPPTEVRWIEFARRAAIEAERKNPAGIRAQCRGCHEVYRVGRGKPLGPQGY